MKRGAPPSIRDLPVPRWVVVLVAFVVLFVVVLIVAALLGQSPTPVEPVG